MYKYCSILYFSFFISFLAIAAMSVSRSISLTIWQARSLVCFLMGAGRVGTRRAALPCSIYVVAVGRRMIRKFDFT